MDLEKYVILRTGEQDLVEAGAKEWNASIREWHLACPDQILREIHDLERRGKLWGNSGRLAFGGVWSEALLFSVDRLG